MKTNPTSLLRVVVVLAMLGSHASAQVSETKSETNSSSKLVIEVNGKKVEAEGTGGVITIRTNGEAIEIDTDGDGKAEEHIDKGGAAKAEAEKIAWLGVKTNEVSPELAAQLELEGGAVVQLIVPGSPADKAGIQEHDIISAIGEAEIITPEDLSDAIRACKPGTVTAVTIVRKAKTVDLKATLGERPQMPKHENLDLRDLDFQGKNVEDIRQQIAKMQKEMLKGMRLPDLRDLGQGADFHHMSEKKTSFSDGDGSITITTKDGATQLEAKDADGNLIYKGPAETEDDRNKLPPKVLKKLEKLEKMDIGIDIEDFENKFLPPALELPKVEPAKPQKPTNTKTKAVTVA